MWTSFVFQKKYHKCQHWWTLTPPLLSSTKHLSPDTTFMWSRSQPLFRWRLLMGEPLLPMQSHMRQPLWNFVSTSTWKRLFSTSSQPFTILSSLVYLGWKHTTLSSIGDPKPSLSAHNDSPLKNPKPKKTPCQVLPRTLWSRTQRGSEPIPILSSLSCQVLRSRAPRWPEPNLVLSRILPRKPTLSGIFFVWSNTFLSGCQESSSLRHPCQPSQQQKPLVRTKTCQTPQEIQRLC